MRAKKCPAARDSRAFKAETKIKSAPNSATASQSQIRFLVRRFGFPPVQAAIVASLAFGEGRKMSARAIITGSLTRPPQRKTSSAGNEYLLLNLRESHGDAARYWAAFVFDASVIAEIERIQAGQPIAVAVGFDAKVYTPPGGEPRVSLSIKVDGALTARRPNKQPKAERQASASTGDARGDL